MNLPSVFQNKNIEQDIDNQQTFYYGHGENLPKTRTSMTGNVETKIKQLFASTSYVYKIAVTIETKEKTFDTTIVGQTGNYLITYDNNLINIKDIIDIYEQ